MNRRSALLIVALLFALASAAAAQEHASAPAQPPAAYRLGGCDVVQRNVLQQPTLDRSLTVRPDGPAVVPRRGGVTRELRLTAGGAPAAQRRSNKRDRRLLIGMRRG